MSEDDKMRNLAICFQDQMHADIEAHIEELEQAIGCVDRGLTLEQFQLLMRAARVALADAYMRRGNRCWGEG